MIALSKGERLPPLQFRVLCFCMQGFWYLPATVKVALAISATLRPIKASLLSQQMRLLQNLQRHGYGCFGFVSLAETVGSSCYRLKPQTAATGCQCLFQAPVSLPAILTALPLPPQCLVL